MKFTHSRMGVGGFEETGERPPINPVVAAVPTVTDREVDSAAPIEQQLAGLPDGVHTASHRFEARKAAIAAAFRDSRFAVAAIAIKDFARSVSSTHAVAVRLAQKAAEMPAGPTEIVDPAE